MSATGAGAATLATQLAGKRLVICVGAGGVGKTTSAAATALGLAERGARVAVVTFDPARRLAGALGSGALANEPRRLDARRFSAQGIVLEGELWAMTLDPKRTFDQLVGRLAADAASREQVLSNRIYRELSSAVAGAQEFSAVAKLYDLARESDFDVIVLDTPPSRNALDFLATPARLTQFVESRALRVLLAPTGLLGRGSGAAFGLLRRITGADLLRDVSAFLGSMGSMLDDMRDRAAGVERLLRERQTTFLLVSSPEREPVAEAVALVAELRGARMPLGAVIVNRVHHDTAAGGDLTGLLGERLALRVAQALADRAVLARRDRAAVALIERAVGGGPPLLVPQLAGDVHDIAGLVAVSAHLFGGRAPSAQRPAR